MFCALAFVFSLLIQTQNFQYAKREKKKTKEKKETKYNKQQKHNIQLMFIKGEKWAHRQRMWDWVAAHFNAQDVFNQYGLHVNKIFLLHFLHPPGIYYIFCFISYFVAFRVCVAVCRIIRECKRECEYECILATNVCTRCIRIYFIIFFFFHFSLQLFKWFIRTCGSGVEMRSTSQISLGPCSLHIPNTNPQLKGNSAYKLKQNEKQCDEEYNIKMC